MDRSMAESLSDATLLERFVSHREEAAFVALVRRHGPRVERICRRILRNEHDVEDVFQATFLVLSRKAAGIPWRDSVSPWIDGVARRLAMHARSGAVRQQGREVSVTALAGVASEHDRAAPRAISPAGRALGGARAARPPPRPRRRIAAAAREVPGAGRALRPGRAYVAGGRPAARLARRIDVAEAGTGPDAAPPPPDPPRAGPRRSSAWPPPRSPPRPSDSGPAGPRERSTVQQVMAPFQSVAEGGEGFGDDPGRRRTGREIRARLRPHPAGRSRGRRGRPPARRSRPGPAGPALEPATPAT